jgi:hypothetical protein
MLERRACDCTVDESGASARTLGHEVPGIYDGVLFWQCSACRDCWPRFDAGDDPRLHAAAVRYLEAHPGGVFTGGMFGEHRPFGHD